MESKLEKLLKALTEAGLFQTPYADITIAIESYRIVVGCNRLMGIAVYDDDEDGELMAQVMGNSYSYHSQWFNEATFCWLLTQVQSKMQGGFFNVYKPRHEWPPTKTLEQWFAERKSA